VPHIELKTQARLFYEERGSGAPIVLLNGLSQTTASWVSHVRAWESSFRTIAYDGRGQGRSELGTSPLTLDAHVDDLFALLDVLGIETATFCGFSHGARVALRAAARNPQRVDRLVLTALGTNDDAQRRVIIRGWLEVLRRGGVEAMAWSTVSDILGRSYLRENEPWLEAIIRATVQRNSREGLEALIEALRGYETPEADARAYPGETLLITSMADRLVDPASARELARHFSDIRHVEVDDCGHTIPIERADAWRAHVEAFMGG
jgi:3-oxoadipate enol-lactonase